MKMKQIAAFLLALVMMLSMAACGGNDGNTTTAPETTEPETTVGSEHETLNTFYMSYSHGEDYFYMSAMVYDGAVNMDFKGDIRKKANLDESVMETITNAFYAAGLDAMDGKSEYGDGEDYASFSADYGENNFLSADFSGQIPADFTTAYEAMEKCFLEVLADVAEYVPAPEETGIIEDADREALNGILSNMTLDDPEYYIISGLQKDENFAYATGLSTDEYAASAVQFASGNMTSPYQLVLISLADGVKAEDVVSDFAANINWRKTVCNPASNACIAVKDNYVLCLVGKDTLYTDTVAAIQAAGWTVEQELENPEGVEDDWGVDVDIDAPAAL